MGELGRARLRQQPAASRVGVSEIYIIISCSFLFELNFDEWCRVVRRAVDRDRGRVTVVHSSSRRVMCGQRERETEEAKKEKSSYKFIEIFL